MGARPLFSLAGLLLVQCRRLRGAIWLSWVLWPVLASLPLQAQNFEVYCTNNADGTTTCTGWEGGETLTCVNNPGGTSSCSTSSGRSFVCILDGGGVASCRSDKGVSAVEKPLGGGTDCTFTGSGNFTCVPARKKEPSLLPSPTLSDPVVPDQPLQIDFDIIQPLNL